MNFTENIEEILHFKFREVSSSITSSVYANDALLKKLPLYILKILLGGKY